MKLIVIIASLLLFAILIYPYIRRICLLIRLGKESLKDKKLEKTSSTDKNTSKLMSVIGKSKFTLRQPLPSATTPIVKDSTFEDAVSNFVPEENQEPMDIDVPLEKEIIEENNVDEEQEAIELEELFGKDIHYASGVDINDLGKLKYVIENSPAEIEVKKQAGKILYENKETDMVYQMTSNNQYTASIISNLIDLHMESYLKENGNTNQAKAPDDIEDFDITQFLKAT